MIAPRRAYSRALASFTMLSWIPSAIADDPRHFVLQYELQVSSLPDATAIDVWMPVPPETACQQIISLDIQGPVDGRITTEGTYGNRVWHARFDRPADGTFRVVQRVEIVRKERQAEQRVETPASGYLQRFLQPSRLVPLTRRFAEIARQTTRGRGEVLVKARALYDHVWRHMAYDKSGTRWGRGDAVYACDAGKGNCTDFHSLFIALNRAAKIPARFCIGFPLPAERGRGSVAGYHCWAEFWVTNVGWVPVDISEADKRPEKLEYFFGTLDENRVLYSVGRDLILTPPQQGPPINFFIYPHVEIDGQPFSELQYGFSYEDLPQAAWGKE